MLRSLFVSTFVLALALPAVTPAQDCDGDPGFELSVPMEVPIGGLLPFELRAPAPQLLVLYSSDGEGPTDTDFGRLCLDFPPLGVRWLPLLDSDVFQFTCSIDCDPGLVGTTAYFQFVALGVPDLDVSGISNQASVTVTDEWLCNYCIDDDGRTQKPQALSFVYTGDGCDATRHSQDEDKVYCEGDPMDAPQVRIIAADKPDWTHHKASIWFDGIVDLWMEYEIDALNVPGKTRLKGDTWIFVYDLDDNLLQWVQFHTSCSQPLNEGDQYGAHLLVGFRPE